MVWQYYKYENLVFAKFFDPIPVLIARSEIPECTSGSGSTRSGIFLFPTALLPSKGLWARCHNSPGNQDTSKNWRCFVDKHEAKVAPGSGLLYSGDVYIGTDDLDTI